jgi:hypothetical protein
VRRGSAAQVLRVLAEVGFTAPGRFRPEASRDFLDSRLQQNVSARRGGLLQHLVLHRLNTENGVVTDIAKELAAANELAVCCQAHSLPGWARSRRTTRSTTVTARDNRDKRKCPFQHLRDPPWRRVAPRLRLVNGLGGPRAATHSLVLVSLIP